MNNKLVFILGLLFLSLNSRAQADSIPATPDTMIVQDLLLRLPHPAKFELALHLHQNSKYKLVGHTIRLYGPRFWQDRLRVRADFEGYRSFVPFKDGVFIGAAEVMKLNLDVDYYRFHRDVGKGFTYYMPHFGPSFSVDISKINKSEGPVFAVTPRVGIDYGLEYGRFRILAQSNFSFYLDGLWMEFQPILNFRIFRRVYLKVALNLVEAVTYSGTSEFGFYAGGGISWHPRNLFKKNKE